MKTKSLLFSVFAVLMATTGLCLTSCGDEEEGGAESPQKQENSLVGKWSVRGIATDEGYEYAYTGVMSIDAQSMTIQFAEAGTGNRGAILKGACAISGNTLRWSSPDPSEPESETFTYSLSDDGNTLTMAFASGTGIDGWVIRTMTATRLGSTPEVSTGEIASSLKGTWYSAYLVIEGQTVYIERGPDGPLDGFYHEFKFEDDGRATMYSWSGDDTWEGLPFAYQVEGNTVTVDLAEFINIDGEYESSLRHIFTYNSENNKLVWHTFSYEGDDAETKIDMDVYFNKK